MIYFSFYFSSGVHLADSRVQFVFIRQMMLVLPPKKRSEDHLLVHYQNSLSPKLMTLRAENYKGSREGASFCIVKEANAKQASCYNFSNC